MKNQEVAKLLNDIADILEIRGEMLFKIIAYRRAAQAIEAMSKDVEDVAAQGKLEEIPGVGKGIAEKIEEYLDKGTLKYLDSIKRGLPPGIEKIVSLEGVGPKKAMLFYKKLKIKSVEDLEKAARDGRIRKIRGMGEKTEQNILKSIELAKQKKSGRMLLGYALDIAEEIIAELKKSKDVDKVNVAGSIRRGRETIGDIDILVTSPNPEKVLDYFTKIRYVYDVIGRGPTKASVHVKNGLQVDLRVLTPEEYGAALMYFTGSKEHNVELRRIAIAKRMKLSEYGLFKGAKFICGKTEEEVYKALGLQYVEPEMRENRGEVELALRHNLPELLTQKDILGDLQMHTKWSDGTNTIEQMADACKALGYEYISITDHVGNLAIAGAIKGKQIDQQKKEIDKVEGIQVLQGAEIDIRTDGTLDVDNETLKKFDVVLASLHSSLKGDGTERILKAMENENVDIIAHPSGRLIGTRPGVELDMEKIIAKAKETGTVLEVNAQPSRLDLNDVQTKAAVEAGVKLSIGTDSHSVEELRYMRLGVTTARRGWAKKEDVINTMPLSKMMKFLKH